MALRLRRLDVRHPLTMRLTAPGHRTQNGTRLRSADRMLPGAPRPILSPPHYTPGCRTDPTQGIDKETAAASFNDWWNALPPNTVTIFSDGSESYDDAGKHVGYGYAIYQGQALVATGKESHRLIDRHAVNIRWSPGHQGITGNEAADSLADAGAKSDTVDPGPTAQPTISGIGSIARSLAHNVTSGWWRKNEPTKPTYANVSKEGEWNLVSKRNNTKSITVEKKLNPIQKRLILIKPEIPNPTSFSPLTIRNKINEAFQKIGIKGPVIAAATLSFNNNIIITTNDPFTSQFLLEKKAIWSNIIEFERIQKDQEWHKVIIHKVPIREFSGPKGMDLILDEIKTFNPDFKPIGTPFWLTPASKELINERVL
ncbi:hypothetical protein DID88_006380 [Monilinia fructigena]|uniref:RNase H type-1 domain-containing protein n=1 Tax=Monilinia fructigena TaxID=38457 RepID=A0A395IJ20_9HELO|nr:hypothetical protein DID88_006380 [Monilinia fructigena]